MSYKDYYQVLGVPREAEAAEIGRAYRRLARKYHPDVSKEADAEVRFRELGEAYEVLKDAEKRRLYDKWGPHWKAISEGRQAPPDAPGSSEVRFDFGPFGVGGNPNDMRSVFETVFAGARPPRGRRRRRTSSARPVDHETTLELTIADAYRGGARDIQFRDGATRETRRLSVTVPAGIRDGQRIRLAGQAAGGRADLYLAVKLADDERFRLKGDDVHTTLRIGPPEAVLGAVATLETLDGEVKVKVPPGSSSGRQIRLRDRGYPGRGGRRGDLYAEIQVVVPAQPTEEEKALYARLAALTKAATTG